ncbi:hypothetical protein [Klebsiella phage BUCT556A]|uniref:Uncharacterized protein n=1 Tax=Klebsiella phage BUCT556A TaxID=2928431 RepID=A0AAE9HHI8_9CAUD|nr:hypothetical protein [Klebsiella phage BUCT556A]
MHAICRSKRSKQAAICGRFVVMWFYGVTLWREKSYLKSAQKMNNKYI